MVLFVDLVEKSTGKIAFSLGYSSTEKVIGSVELTERNLLGKGQYLRINTTASFKKQSVDFSFTEPYFMGMPISAGFDLFATNTDNTDFSSYKSRQVGGALRTGFDLDEYSSLDFKYYLAFRKTKGIDAQQSPPLPSSRRKAITGNRLSAPPIHGMILITPTSPPPVSVASLMVKSQASAAPRATAVSKRMAGTSSRSMRSLLS